MINAILYPGQQHNRRQMRRTSMIVLGYLALAYWFTGWQLPALLSAHPDINFYLVQPAIWGGLALLTFYAWQRLPERPPFVAVLTGVAFVVGLFHLSVLVIAGVLVGFGESPTAGALINYPKNLLYIVTLLAGIETARAYLYSVWRRINETAAFFATTLIFFAVVIPAAQWTVIDDTDSFLRVGIGNWLPALILSVLATWLVDFGGLGLSFAYRFPLVAFVWFSPRLPDLDWPVLALIGLLAPLAAMALIQNIYEPVAQPESQPTDRDRDPPGADPWGG